MRRQALLNQVQIDRSLRLTQLDGITNYETRMVAEVELYWIIYNKCGSHPVTLSETKLALRDWQQEWASLFGRHNNPHGPSRDPAPNIFP